MLSWRKVSPDRCHRSGEGKKKPDAMDCIGLFNSLYVQNQRVSAIDRYKFFSGRG